MTKIWYITIAGLVVTTFFYAQHQEPKKQFDIVSLSYLGHSRDPKMTPKKEY